MKIATDGNGLSIIELDPLKHHIIFVENWEHDLISFENGTIIHKDKNSKFTIVEHVDVSKIILTEEER